MFIPILVYAPLEEVLKNLNDKECFVRQSACRIFGPTRDDIPIEEVVKRLNDEDWHVRCAAWEAFGLTRKDIPIEEVVKRLNDENEMVHKSALKVFKLGKGYRNNERHASICHELNALYEKKNHDYGDSFHQSWLEEGYAMARGRLSDKLNRFKILTLKDSECDTPMVQDESIRDTLLDLANYAIMTIMELDADKQHER